MTTSVIFFNFNSTSSYCKDKGIRKVKFVAKSQLFYLIEFKDVCSRLESIRGDLKLLIKYWEPFSHSRCRIYQHSEDDFHKNRQVNLLLKTPIMTFEITITTKI